MPWRAVGKGVPSVQVPDGGSYTSTRRYTWSDVAPGPDAVWPPSTYRRPPTSTARPVPPRACGSGASPEPPSSLVAHVPVAGSKACTAANPSATPPASPLPGPVPPNTRRRRPSLPAAARLRGSGSGASASHRPVPGSKRATAPVVAPAVTPPATYSFPSTTAELEPEAANGGAGPSVQRLSAGSNTWRRPADGPVPPTTWSFPPRTSAAEPEPVCGRLARVRHVPVARS